jgi:hypothetical protein
MTMPNMPLQGNVGSAELEGVFKYYGQVYSMTNKILDAMLRCGLGREYWFSTKDHSATAVIHCEEYCWQGNILQVSVATEESKTAEEFWAAISLTCERQEYPWVQFKGDK